MERIGRDVTSIPPELLSLIFKFIFGSSTLRETSTYPGRRWEGPDISPLLVARYLYVVGQPVYQQSITSIILRANAGNKLLNPPELSNEKQWIVSTVKNLTIECGPRLPCASCPLPNPKPSLYVTASNLRQESVCTFHTSTLSLAHQTKIPVTTKAR